MTTAEKVAKEIDALVDKLASSRNENFDKYQIIVNSIRDLQTVYSNLVK